MEQSTVKIKKGTVLQTRGDSHLKGYIVVKGLLRSYTIDEKGKEHIFMFAPEGWTIGDMEAVTMNKKTDFYVDALEDSECYIANDIDQLAYLNTLTADKFQLEFQRLVKRVGVLQRRVIMLMSATALERYQDFIKTYPQIVQRVPQKMIASYLGVTPEALSKLRSESLKS